MTHAPISWRRREASEADCDICGASTPKADLERCVTCGAYVCEGCRDGATCTSCAKKHQVRP